MLNRRGLLMSITMYAALSAVPAFAFETKICEAKAFESAKASGRPILIEVSAPWCPTCRAQKPILVDLAKKPKFKDFAAFEIDFDTSKALLRTLNVRQQSTLIAFKGADEVGRSVGDTDAASIESLLDKAM